MPKDRDFTPEQIVDAVRNIRSLNLLQVAKELSGTENLYYEFLTFLEKRTTEDQSGAAKFMGISSSRAVFIQDLITIRNLAASLGGRGNPAINRQVFALVLDAFDKMANLTPEDLTMNQGASK